MLLRHEFLFLLPQEEAVTLPLGTGSELRQKGRGAGKKNPLRMVDRSTLGIAMQRESPDQRYWYTARPFGNVQVRMNSNSGSHWLELPNTTREMEENSMEPGVR